MIVVDILHNIFEILPELILGAGPFCVFKGMGTGKDSGKLLFKKIYSDGGLSITEDASSLDLSASGGSTDAIDICEIAFGTSTTPGVTSSMFQVCESQKTLHSFSIIGGDNLGNSNYHLYNNTDSTIIVGGNRVNVNVFSRNSVIAGGYVTKLIGPGSTNHENTTSVAGYRNYFECSSNSAMLSNFYSLFRNSCNVTTISNYYSQILFTDGGFFLGERSYSSGNVKIPTNNSRITVLGGKLKGGQYSYVLRSDNSLILNGGKLYDSKSTSIFGKLNIICNSNYSAITSGHNGRIYQGCFSTIMNGYSNKIINTGAFSVCNSTILNGYKNYIRYKPGYSNSISNSIIVHGSYNIIYGCKNNAILNGVSNDIRHKPPNECSKNNVIINGANSCIRAGCNSVLSAKFGRLESNNSVLISSVDAGSSEQTVVVSANSVSLNLTIGEDFSGIRTFMNSGCNNSIFSVGCGTSSVSIGSVIANDRIRNSSIITLQGTVSISGTVSNSIVVAFCESEICGRTQSLNLGISRNTYSSAIIGNRSKLINACESVIISGKMNQIETANRSVIIGGYNNAIDGFSIADQSKNSSFITVFDSVILGGHNNSIQRKNSNPYPMIIIGGSFSSICGTFSIVPNLDAREFSVWDRNTLTTTNGLTDQKTNINSITVCKGILISWT